MKQTFLILYDYETGGVWARMAAISQEEIEQKFPELVVYSERPSWMSDDVYSVIENQEVVDIEGFYPDWLKTIMNQRD